jgi:uncharacterized protein
LLALLGFAGTMAVVTGLIHLYLWKRLVRDTTRPGRWRRAGGLLVVLLALLIPTTVIGVRGGTLPWLAWIGYVWLGVMFYLLVLLAVLEVPVLAARLWLRPRASRRATGGSGRVGAAADTETGSTRVGAAAQLGSTQVGAASATGSALSGGSDTAGAAPEIAPGQSDGPGRDVDQAPDHDPSRRLLLARSAAIFAGLTAAGLTGYGVRSALGPPQFDRVQIPLAKLPRAMDGTRIAVVADIHLGPFLGRAHTERIVAMINQLDADVVAVVGDLVDGSVAELGSAAAPLRDIRSRHGAYFVTGNHEYYSGYAEWVAEVERLGLQPLRNERREISARGGVLDLAGVNDIAGADFGDPADFPRTFAGRDPSRPVILLAHQPVQAFEAAGYGVDLQLSGHTHGGQMVPFSLLVRLQQPVVSGFGRVDGVPVYVTNGAGFWGPPVRIGAPPQVTLVELRAP